MTCRSRGSFTRRNLVVRGTAVTGTLTTTQATTDLVGYLDDDCNGQKLVVMSGAAQGEQVYITDYFETNGRMVFDALSVPMVNGDIFKIV